MAKFLVNYESKDGFISKGSPFDGSDELRVDLENRGVVSKEAEKEAEAKTTTKKTTKRATKAKEEK